MFKQAEITSWTKTNKFMVLTMMEKEGVKGITISGREGVSGFSSRDIGPRRFFEKEKAMDYISTMWSQEFGEEERKTASVVLDNWSLRSWVNGPFFHVAEQLRETGNAEKEEEMVQRHLRVL